MKDARAAEMIATTGFDIALRGHLSLNRAHAVSALLLESAVRAIECANRLAPNLSLSAERIR